MTCSGDKKVTTMILRVDLQCCQCYKKVKKILCKFPQIRDQIYDEKQNMVIITVVCCSPEKIMDKLCSKGRKTIKSIEIKDPAPAPNKPAPQNPKPKPNPTPSLPEKPIPIPAAPAPEPPKPKPKPNPTPVPVPVPIPVSDDKPQMKKNGSKSGSNNASTQAPAQDPPKPPVPMPEPVAQWIPGYPPCPPPQIYPVSVCCGSCYEGRPGGPCYHGGYGPDPGYGYQYGRPPCDYFCEENPSACSIM